MCWNIPPVDPGTANQMLDMPHLRLVTCRMSGISSQSEATLATLWNEYRFCMQALSCQQLGFTRQNNTFPDVDSSRLPNRLQTKNMVSRKRCRIACHGAVSRGDLAKEESIALPAGVNAFSLAGAGADAGRPD